MGPQEPVFHKGAHLPHVGFKQSEVVDIEDGIALLGIGRPKHRTARDQLEMMGACPVGPGMLPAMTS